MAIRHFFSTVLLVTLLAVGCAGIARGGDLTVAVSVVGKSTPDPAKTGQESLEKALTGYKLSDITCIQVSAGRFEESDWKKLKENSRELSGLKRFELTDALESVATISLNKAYFGTSIQELYLAKLTSVNDDAFNDCSSLTSISLPSVTSVGASAFMGCKNLTSVSLPSATEIEYRAFSNCASLTSISLPKATKIGENAFYECTGLASVQLPLATTIGSYAFTRCTSLTSVSLPASTKIRDFAFLDCRSLTSVSLSKALEVGKQVFENCVMLSNISLPVVTRMGLWAFNNCTSLTSISLPAVKQIDHWAFMGCTSLAEVSFPVVEEVSSGAFKGCTSLQSISLPAVKEIKKNTFNGCTRLQSVSLPNATDIGGSAFNNCTSLTSISLPKVIIIGEGAFYSCTSLTSVSLPESTDIMMYAFEACSSLTNVLAPKATEVGGAAFRDCRSLTSVSLPLCTSIRRYTFDGCSSLISVSLPRATELGDEAFSGCSGLKSIRLRGNQPPSVGGGTFTGCPENRTLLLVNTVGELLVKDDLASAIEAYDKAEGEPNDGKWYGWRIEKTPPTLLVVHIEPLGSGKASITHKERGTIVNPGDTLKKGDTLVVTTTPDTGYGLITLMANHATNIRENEWEVTAEPGETVVFWMEFARVATLGATTIEPAGAGEVVISYSDDGTRLKQGDAIMKGRSLMVTATAHDGYQWKETRAIGATRKNGNEWDVTATSGTQVIFTVEFEMSQTGGKNNDPTPVESILFTQVRLYPNPTSGQLTIDAGAIVTRCEVYSSTGILLQSVEPLERLFTIDLTASQTGVYLVRLVDIKGESRIQRILKQ